MMTGFVRRKSRQAMRLGVPVLSRWEFFRMRRREMTAYLKGMVKLILEVEELWLQTRRRSEAERCVVEEMERLRASFRRRLHISEMQLAYARARVQFPSLHVPSRVTLNWRKWNLWLDSGKVYTRADINERWQIVLENLRQRRAHFISPLRIVSNLWLDFQVTLMFAFAILWAKEE